MSRSVCTKCWTWYSNGETVCPTCGTLVMPGDAPPGFRSPASSAPEGSSASNHLAGFSPLPSMIVGGSPALAAIGGTAAPTANCAPGRSMLEVILVNHAHHTYQIGLTAANSQFDRLRTIDLGAVIASWQWNK